MNLAFVLYKYFPFGGLQRDFLAIAQACVARGASARVYTTQWQGEVPATIEVRVIAAAGISNHRRYAQFHRQLLRQLGREPADAVVGFNKTPGLDIYYAADGCFARRVAQRSGWYGWLPRTRHLLAAERAVFGADANTHILTLSPTQQSNFMTHYPAAASRCQLLPPGIARDRMAGADAAHLRCSVRQELSIGAHEKLVLLIGSGFATKGLDRALRAVAALAQSQRQRVQLVAIGQDAPRKYLAMARRFGIGAQVRILAGRNDIPRLLQGADLLLHPAYAENTGAVLLEAVVAGLPVLTTDVCGYAHYVVAAQAGQVLSSPFSQTALNRAFADMLDAPERNRWRANGIAFGRENALYDMPETAADLILKMASARANAKALARYGA